MHCWLFWCYGHSFLMSIKFSPAVLDNSSITSASTMTEKLGVYPLFSCPTGLMTCLLLSSDKILFKAQAPLQIHYCPVILLLVLFLDSYLVFIPYSVIFLSYDMPQGRDIGLFVIAWLYFGNFIPFVGSYTYNFAWLPALLFNVRL